MVSFRPSLLSFIKDTFHIQIYISLQHRRQLPPVNKSDAVLRYQSMNVYAMLQPYIDDCWYESNTIFT